MGIISLFKEISKNKLFLVTIIFFLITLVYNINTNGIYVTVAFSFFLFLIPNKTIYITKTAIYIICFSITYSSVIYLNNDVNSWFNLISYLISPLLFYVFGGWLINSIKTLQNLYNLLLIILFCFSALVYVYMIHSIIDIGIVNNMRKISLPFLNEGYNATYYGLNVCLGFAGLFFFLNKKKKDFISILYFVLFLLSLLVVIHVVNRSGLVTCLLLFVLYYIYITKSKTKLIYNLIVGSILLLCIYIIGNEFLSQDIIEAYNARENQDTGTQRIERWIYALGELFTNPFGFKLQGFDGIHVHNFLLDIARVTGIFPFFFIILATICSLMSSYKLYKIDFDNRYILIVMLNMSFIISSMLEPIVESIPMLLYLACMIWGMQDRILLLNKYRMFSR